jgi:glycosyltransferase involved in cell wall biosynthesis
MTLSPFFSVIIPVHNKAPHVDRAINSVLTQSCTDFELVIIDDASTDGSADKITAYSEERIKLHKRSDPGPGGYAARNLGIENANGQWVAFLDADDMWFPDHLKNLQILTNKYPQAEMLCSAWLEGDGDDRTPNPFSRNRKSDLLLSPEEYLKAHAKGVDVVNTDVVAIQKATLVKMGGFPQYSQRCKRAGDGQTWLRVVLSGAYTAWTPSLGAIYYQDAVNMVTQQQKYHIHENGLITYLDDIIQDNKHPEYKKLLKKYRNQRVASSLFQDLKTGGVGSEHLRMAVRYFSWDARIMALFVAYFVPQLGRSLFAMKERAKTVQ